MFEACQKPCTTECFLEDCTVTLCLRFSSSGSIAKVILNVIFYLRTLTSGDFYPHETHTSVIGSQQACMTAEMNVVIHSLAGPLEVHYFHAVDSV